MIKQFIRIIFFLCILFSPCLGAEDQQLTLIDGSGHGRILQTLTFDKEEYLPLTEVVDAWGAQARWSELEGNADVKFPGHSLRFSADNTFFVCDSKSFNLYNPVRLYQGELWVPLELFKRYLVPQWGRSVFHLWSQEMTPRHRPPTCHRFHRNQPVRTVSCKSRTAISSAAPTG